MFREGKDEAGLDIKVGGVIVEDARENTENFDKL